ncbi:MAG: hypothetical protein H0V22_09355 [Solirubrobacterales bacterium]|nr:hypothetical protein [Solirubrobacterales bacterium]
MAPTPHPLATFAGIVLSPLGGEAHGAAVLLALLFLGALGWVTYALGSQWFGPAAGVLAAVIILTRQPVLSFGVRAYVDVPYLVLVLSALLVEARRSRAGLPVLVILGLAGLLRPEAWLFSAAYVGWMLLDPACRADRPRVLALLAAAAVAPLVWALADLAVTGDLLYSLTGTRENAEVLNRKTGLSQVPLTVPRRLGEILREPVLLGAALGGGLALALLPRRAALPAAAGVLSILAFCVLAGAGLPILGRYLLLPATLLAIFCGAGAFGWLELARDDPWRRRWLAAAVVVGLALLAFTPRQIERIDSLRSAIAVQRAIVSDLHDLAETGAIRSACGPVAVPNHRPVPLLALWLDRPAAEIVSAQLTRPRVGSYVAPASARVERSFTLDRNDPRRLTAAVPPAFERVTGNASWTLFARCR